MKNKNTNENSLLEAIANLNYEIQKLGPDCKIIRIQTNRSAKEQIQAQLTYLTRYCSQESKSLKSVFGIDLEAIS